MNFAEVEDRALGYEETAASIFSLCEFSWREVRLRTGPSFPANRLPGSFGESNGNSAKAGGFGYEESSHNASPCRNRVILWHYCDHRLKLLELSFDLQLAHNALELVLDEGNYLLSDVFFHEYGESDLMVLFATATTAYRLLLPHPHRVSKSSSLAATGDGMVPSVLAFVEEYGFIGSNTAPLFNDASSVSAVTSCAACVGVDGVTTFALGLPSGSTSIIQIQPPQQEGLPVRSELSEASMVGKLLSSFLPIVGRRGGVSEIAPTSLLLHVFEGQVVVIAVCTDLNLRVWSVELSQCVMTYSLSQHLLYDMESKVDQLLLRAAVDSPSTPLHFAVHIRTPEGAQISIFEMSHADDQLYLHSVHSYTSPEDSSLVDFSLSRREVWGLWVCQGEEQGEGDKTLLQKALYYHPMASTGLRDIALTPLPDKEPLILPHREPREFFMEAIFHPGRFCIKAIIKALELYNASIEKVPSLTELATEATLRVEHEVQSSAVSLEMSSVDYRQLSIKCWSKFYSYCLEYQELESRAVGVFQEPGTGMAVLLKQGVVSFLKPAEISTNIEGVEFLPVRQHNTDLQQDVGRFIECAWKTANRLSPTLRDTYLLDLARPDIRTHMTPANLADELADAILDESWASTVFLSSDIEEVWNMYDVMDLLLKVLDPLQEGVSGGVAQEGVTGSMAQDMEGDEEYRGYSDLQTSTYQLFASPVSLKVLSSSFQEVCLSRLCLCRDILVLLYMMRRSLLVELLSYAKKDYNMLFSGLAHCYFTLYWLATHTLQPATSSQDANLKQFASLAISGSGRGSGGNGNCPTLILQYVSSYGYREIAAELARWKVLPKDTNSHTHWTTCMPKMVEILISSLWPVSSSCKVAEFLLENAQYNHLQAYFSMVMDSDIAHCRHSLWYLKGQGFIQTGEMDKAFDCLKIGFGGIGSKTDPLLRHVVEWDDSEEEACSARYFETVMRMFEQVPDREHIIKTAESALMLLGDHNPKSTIFWSYTFKYELELGNAPAAHTAMLLNPDSILRMDCLRRLVVVLTEQNRIRELVEAKYIGIEKEAESVMEERARSLDVAKHNYYDVLYCFHAFRHNFRKAAFVMYEYGLRLGRETTGPQALKKQGNCYSMCIMALRLADPKYAWVVRPVQEGKGTEKRRSHRKRNRRAGKGDGKQAVEVLTVADIEKDYALVRAKLDLLQKEPSFTTQLCSPFVSAEEVSALLVQAGMFDAAIKLATHLALPLVPILEALASRCVQFSNVACSQQQLDKVDWEWLSRNEGLDTLRTRETSIADKAWGMLRTALQRVGKQDQAKVLRNVARKLLSMGTALPQWLLDTYKKTNPAELLELYLTFDLLEPSLLLAIEYINAVLGQGKEFFGLETALHVTSHSMWLPHSVFLHLQSALSDAPSGSSLEQLSEQYNAKLKDYLEEVAKVSRNKELAVLYKDSEMQPML